MGASNHSPGTPPHKYSWYNITYFTHTLLFKSFLILWMHYFGQKRFTICYIHFYFKVSTKILSSTAVFNIDNNKAFWAPNQRIRMISEELCDTESCSNGCWKRMFAITGMNLKIYSKRKVLFYIVIIFHNITVSTVFLIKYMQPLVSIRYLKDSKFLNSSLCNCIGCTQCESVVVVSMLKFLFSVSSSSLWAVKKTLLHRTNLKLRYGCLGHRTSCCHP